MANRINYEKWLVIHARNLSAIELNLQNIGHGSATTIENTGQSQSFENVLRVVWTMTPNTWPKHKWIVHMNPLKSNNIKEHWIGYTVWRYYAFMFNIHFGYSPSPWKVLYSTWDKWAHCMLCQLKPKWPMVSNGKHVLFCGYNHAKSLEYTCKWRGKIRKLALLSLSHWNIMWYCFVFADTIKLGCKVLTEPDVKWPPRHLNSTLSFHRLT